MKCSQCNNVAIDGYGKDPVLWLCLDCSIKYQTLEASRLDKVALLYNQSMDAMEHMAGVGRLGPRIPMMRQQLVHQGPMNLHHINISGGNIGVLNTGTVTSIDNAVGVLNRAGADAASNAIKELTEAIAKAPDITDDNKKRALESLSVVATEATAPPERRKGAVIRALLQDVVAVTAATTSLIDIGEKLSAVIQAALN